MTSCAPRLIILSDQLLAMAEGNRRLEKCQVCDIKFTPRDSEIVRKGAGKNSTKWYHVGCAHKVNII